MFVFFRCVAEAVVEQGVRGLAEMVPGGAYAHGIADAAWRKYRERLRDDDIRAEIQRIAQAPADEVRRSAAEATGGASGAAPGENLVPLELYLAQIPAAVQQTFKRPDDPSGTTVPAAFALNTPDDVVRLLPPRPPRFRPGDPLPDRPGWVLERVLGAGGFGEVWLARHPDLASLARAVKFCHGLQARDRDLLHEGRVVDRVMRHGQLSGIVPLIDAHLGGDAPWLMFEYVPGGDLADWVRHLRTLPPDARVRQAVLALRQLAAAVGHFHRLDPPVVHRDLKPSNVLFDRENERLLVTDFGIGAVAARTALTAEAGGSSTRGGRLLSHLRGSYTPMYASPQQRAGAAPDPRDDVHALGVIGYQMLTGHLDRGAGPDFADDLREAGAEETLVTLLVQCVGHRPERRPADAAEFAARLDEHLPARPQPTAALMPTPAAAPPPRPSPPAGTQRAGVIDSIAEFLSAADADHPLSKQALLDRLTERFPDRSPHGMRSTINAQVPHRLGRERGLDVRYNQYGYWIAPAPAAPATANRGDAADSPTPPPVPATDRPAAVPAGTTAPLPFPHIPMDAFRREVEEHRRASGYPGNGRDVVYVYRATAAGASSHHPLFTLPPDAVRDLLGGRLLPEQSLLFVHRDKPGGFAEYDLLAREAVRDVDPATGSIPVTARRMPRRDAEVAKRQFREALARAAVVHETNWARTHEPRLEELGHYVRCPQDGDLTDVHFYARKMRTLSERGQDFCLVFAGRPDAADDFYTIPYAWLKDMLTDVTLSRLPKGDLWQISIDRDTGVVSVGVKEHKVSKPGGNEFRGRRLNLG